MQPKNRPGRVRFPLMTATTAIIVPCRLESTRFPRKLLHRVKGKPLVLWVAERIREEAPEFPCWFAVDDPLLAGPLEAAGFKTVMTSVSHQSGTDRIAEANRTAKAARVASTSATVRGPWKRASTS